MKGLIKYGLAAAMVFATAMPAMARMARSFDICAGATDLATQDNLAKAGASLTVAANIFPKGTIPMGGVPLCSDITTPVIGTFYANVSLQAGLGSKTGLPAAPDVQGFVTWQFDFSPEGGTFATIGIVPISTGVGQTYIQTLVGSSGKFPGTGRKFPGNGQVTVTSLDPTGFQFRITLPRSDDDDD
jgi:hypothetical protein